MAVLPHHRPVECKTIDGTIIAGWLYTVDGPAPAIIMSHGVRFLQIEHAILLKYRLGTYRCTQFNCVKEMTLPEVAEAFHSKGYNVLLYDARSVGASGGQPRNLLNPMQIAEDLSGG